MNDHEMLHPLTETLALEMQIAFQSLIPVMPALLVWDRSENTEGGFRLRIYPRHANHIEEAIHILLKLMDMDLQGNRIDVDFTYGPPEQNPDVVFSLDELIADPGSIRTRLRGGSSIKD